MFRPRSSSGCYARMLLISAEQRRALQLLVDAPLGTTEELLMLARGFDSDILAALLRDGLVTKRPEAIRVGRRTVEVARVRITEAGRRVLKGDAFRRSY